MQGSGNYVVGPYADNFVTTGGVTTNFSNYFNYPFFNNDGTIDNNIQNGDRWSTIVIRDLLEKGSNDNWENSQQESKKGTYKVWRYATENVIPGIEQQVNGISTGVVFKAKMIGSTEPLKEGTTLPQNEKDVIAALNSTDPNFGLRISMTLPSRPHSPTLSMTPTTSSRPGTAPTLSIRPFSAMEELDIALRLEYPI